MNFRFEIHHSSVKLKSENWLEHWTAVSFCLKRFSSAHPRSLVGTQLAISQFRNHHHHHRQRNSHYSVAKLPYNHVRDICFYAVAVYLRKVLFPGFKDGVKKDSLEERKTEADC